MYLSSFGSWLLLVGYFLFLSNALHIPRDARNDLVYRNVDLSHEFKALDLERRAKPKPKPQPQPAPKPSPKPNSQTSSKAPAPEPSSKAVAPPKPITPSPSTKPTSVAECSKSGKFTVCPSSSIAASSIRLEVPRPTIAYDACNLPGIDCFGDLEGFKEIKDPEDWPDYEKGKSIARSIDDPAEASTELWLSHRSLQKRGDREYEVFGTGAGSLVIESLGYPGRSKLFTDSRAKKYKLKAHAYQFKPNQGVGGFIVEDLKTTPGTTAIEDFVVEHIIELQTIKMFIEDAVTNSKVDENFFRAWWNKNLDYNTFYSRPASPQAPIADWKVPKAKAPKVAPPDKWRTLNNLVFNALGSARNREDFVLCDAKINSMKERLWHAHDPMVEKDFKKISELVAKGALTDDVHFSAIRHVLGVFKYFEDATVTSKLRSAIKHVGAELTSANIAHLTSNQVTNIDLQPLWQKFMEKKLQSIETAGTEWVNKAIKVAENSYKTELADLQAQEKKLTADQNNKAQLDKYNTQRKTIQTQAQPLKQKWHNADKRRDDAEDVLNKLAATLSAKDKKVVNAKKELEGAKNVALDAQAAYNLKLREGNKLDLTEVKRMITIVKEAQAMLATFKAYNNSFKMPTAK